MRRITEIIIHCSATEAGKNYYAADIDKWHKERGYAGIGYHYVIDLDGTIEYGRNVAQAGAHCLGHNLNSIGICYIGGLRDGKPEDTRTDEQKTAMRVLVDNLMQVYPTIVDVLGHRDTSKDINGNGVIDANERIKECPCFSVRDEFPMAVCIADRKK